MWVVHADMYAERLKVRGSHLYGLCVSMSVQRQVGGSVSDHAEKLQRMSETAV